MERYSFLRSRAWRDLLLPKLVIIGANAAGVHAANAARKTDPKADITIIDKEPYPAYSRCGIPYVLGGEIPSLKTLLLFLPLTIE